MHTIQKEKPIIIPDDILSKYLDAASLQNCKNASIGIFSVTVFAQKPLTENCCKPGSGCC